MSLKNNPATRRPLVRSLYTSPLSGADIEAQSLKIIDREAPPSNFTPDEWQVVRRMIHTTGDFSLAESVRFSPTAIPRAAAALREGRPIYVDSNMIRSGLSFSRLKSVNGEYGAERVICHVADEDIAEEARAAGLPRSLFAVRKAKRALQGGIAVFGNAPVALMELNRMIIEEELRPAFVVAMPVGFVHVTESKEEFMSLGIPYIGTAGRRGGSPLAVSVIHALCLLAGGEKIMTA